MSEELTPEELHELVMIADEESNRENKKALKRLAEEDF